MAVAVVVVSVLLFLAMVAVVCAVVVRSLRLAKYASRVVHREEVPPEAPAAQGYTALDRPTHELSYRDGVPLVNMSSSNAYVCECTQETCSAAEGVRGDEHRYVRDLADYGPGWGCRDMVFGVRERSGPLHTAAPAAAAAPRLARALHVDPAERHRDIAANTRHSGRATEWVDEVVYSDDDEFER